MINFVNISEKEFLSSKRLYKHLPLEFALKTIEDKSLWFSNPKVWDDPFEKRFLEAKYTRTGKEVSFSWIDRVFCTCMTMTSSSEAYWKAYSTDQICVELRINREVLLEELKKLTGYEVYLGKVEYMQTKDIIKPIKDIPFDPRIAGYNRSGKVAARLFMLKRISFSYENEFRILINPPKKINKNGVSVPYLCDPTDLINQIVIDPRVGDRTFNMLKSWFGDRYGFERTDAGAARVLQSQLYAPQKQAVIPID